MAVRVSSVPPRSPPLPGAGDVIAGKFRLERLLTQGGMGAVWVATHLGLDERVAVKFMDPRRVSSPEARMRFTREAKAAAQVRSRHIVQMLDHGVDRGVPYIAMELLGGEDLGVRLRRAGRLTLGQAADILDAIAHAMERAHAAGIVHRDLKPENIFLAKDGDQEVPKVLDFGIALEVQGDATDDSATQEDIILGTPYFMSPEQVRGRTGIDHRSDLWSIGVILFRAITGMRPFGRGAPADVIVQICSDPIPRASKVAPDLPHEIDRFFEKALARDVSKRFSSAKEMAAAFGEIARAADASERTQTNPSGVLRRAPLTPGAPRKGSPPLPGVRAREPAAAHEAPDERQARAVVDNAHPDRAPSAADGASSGSTSAPTPLAAAATDTSPVTTASPTGTLPLEPPASPLASKAAASGTTGTLPAAAPASTGTLPTAASARDPSPVSAATGAPPEPEGPASASLTAAAITAEVLSADGGPVSTSASERASMGPTSTTTAPQTTAAASRASVRSRVWLVLLGAAIAAGAMLFTFRDKIFAPPGKDPTIVLTAGTVVLVAPGQSPAVASEAAHASPAPAGAPAASATATNAASATAPEVSAAVPAASSSAPVPTAAAGASATAAPKESATAAPKGTTASSPGASRDTKPATTSTTRKPDAKDSRDLGY